MYFQEFSLTFLKNDNKVFDNIYKNLSSSPNSIKLNLLEYITSLDIEKEIFIRENDEFLFTLDIKNKKCTILLKKEEISINVLVEFCELKVSENQITLEYMIESDDTRNIIIITKRSDKNE